MISILKRYLVKKIDVHRLESLRLRKAEMKEQIKGKMNSRSYREEIFTKIYHERWWGAGESASGLGSTSEYTTHLRKSLSELIKRINATSILDAPCGDFHWMKDVDVGNCKYIGVDIVRDIISHNRFLYEAPSREFHVADITQDPLPSVDLIICRDCFIHLPLRD